MPRHSRFIILSNRFFDTYPSTEYPEIEQKPNRPYVQIRITINGVDFAAPLRLHIRRQNEFEVIRYSERVIRESLRKYIRRYKRAKRNLGSDKDRMIVQFSTLQYFEEEISNI